ncbi:MAG: hypothetical protein ACLFVT_08045, partial [Syntrophobacteria bacterium]
MSGLVVAFGKPEQGDLQKMLEKIAHRGPHVSGTFANKRVMMAQNYLHADVGAGPGNNMQVPVGSSRNGERRICYDGQVGNQEDLSLACGVESGPFREEKVLLRLYEQHGPDMLPYLDDAIFAFVISNGEEIFAARDLLGIKTLFYGRKGDTLYFASELKSLVAVTEEVYEFPPGHYMDSTGGLIRFAALPEAPPEALQTDLEEMIQNIRSIIERSVRNRVDFSLPIA